LLPANELNVLFARIDPVTAKFHGQISWPNFIAKFHRQIFSIENIPMSNDDLGSEALPHSESTSPTGPESDWRVTAYVFDQLESADRTAIEQLIASDDRYRAAIAQTKALAGELVVQAQRIDDTSSRAVAGGSLSPERMTVLNQAFAEGSASKLNRGSANGHRRRLRLVSLLAIAAGGVGVVAWGTRPGSEDARSTSLAVAVSDIKQQMAELKNPSNESADESADKFQSVDALRRSMIRAVESTSSQPAPEPAPVEAAPVEAAPVEAAPVEAAPVEAAPAEAAPESEVSDLTVSEAAPDPAPYSAASSSESEESAPAEAKPLTTLATEGLANQPLRSELSVPDGGTMLLGGLKNQSELNENSLESMPASVDFMDREFDAARPLEQMSSRMSVAESASGDRFAPIVDNAFIGVKESPWSTFSIDVDTASYSKVRMALLQRNQLPHPDAVRIEELVNYFTYDYPQPTDEQVPFSAAMEVATCPWNSEHRLARVAIKGREMENSQRAVSNLVFLLDVSGSMNEPNKLPLVKRGMQTLVRQLGENDRVAIVVYAGAAGMVLDSTTADHQSEILASLDRLQAGGSTNGAQGIQLAYQTARDHFVEGGTNRVILCTDGDFNVGTTGTDDLVSLVEREAKGGVFLSVLGYGEGNLNDAMLEAISGRGDGNYAFIDSDAESRKVFVEQLTGTLVTIAKDVKIQIEFNPRYVSSYRLIGYENRMLAARDFNDDTKDAGEIGAGHTVTALYELVPVGASTRGVDPLKYQENPVETPPVVSDQFADELLTLKLRYKAPTGGESQLLEFPIVDAEQSFEQASLDFRFAAAVASYGMLLRNSSLAGDANLSKVREWAMAAVGKDPRGLRTEFISLIDAAASIKGSHE
jgi:Ca-activated chloride channel family protein